MSDREEMDANESLQSRLFQRVVCSSPRRLTRKAGDLIAHLITDILRRRP